MFLGIAGNEIAFFGTAYSVGICDVDGQVHGCTFAVDVSVAAVFSGFVA